MRRFEGKVVLITGGTSGMGLAAAKRLLAEGAQVIVTGQQKEHLESARQTVGAGAKFTAIASDAASPSAAKALIDTIAERPGRLDALFANAGAGLFKPIRETTEKDFERVFALNVKGLFFLVQQSLRLLRRGGAVLLTASWTAHRGLPDAHLYSSSKAAVASLARTLGSELGREGIRVNSLSPGYIDTPIIRLEGEAKARRAHELPLDRWGQADEIAPLVAFLLSDEASYVNGQDFGIDGGLVGAHTYR